MAHAARIADTVEMELLEREPSLALLADYAAEARRGDGRLVVLGGEAGVGKTALLERFQRDLPGARWSWGACDGLFTRARSGRCTTWPISWAANCWICVPAGRTGTSSSGPCCARSAGLVR